MNRGSAIAVGAVLAFTSMLAVAPPAAACQVVVIGACNGVPCRGGDIIRVDVIGPPTASGQAICGTTATCTVQTSEVYRCTGSATVPAGVSGTLYCAVRTLGTLVVTCNVS
jgi:hypothetical protein